MYKEFRIENFRCFKDLTIGPLGRINLIGGRNSIGKTSLLEALWLNAGYHNPNLGIGVDVIRGLTHFRKPDIMKSLFKDFTTDIPIKFTSTRYDGKHSELNIIQRQTSTSRDIYPVEIKPVSSTDSSNYLSEGYTTEVLFEYKDGEGKETSARAYIKDKELKFENPKDIEEPNSIFVHHLSRSNQNEIAGRFSTLSVNKLEHRIIDFMRIINEDINEISIEYIGGSPVFYVDTGGDIKFPLTLLGDGITNLLIISTAIYEARNGITLIDEIDTGLHFSVLTKLWPAVAEWSKESNTQIYATTHSQECIIAAVESLTSNKITNNDFRYHRLEKVGDKIKAISFSLDELWEALDSGMEIR